MKELIKNKKYNFICKLLKKRMLAKNNLTHIVVPFLKEDNIKNIYVCVAMNNKIYYQDGMFIGIVKYDKKSNSFIIFERIYINLKILSWNINKIYKNALPFKMAEYINLNIVKILDDKDIKLYNLIKRMIEKK